MHLVFWQPIPSFHQEGFLNELAKQPWVDSVQLKVEQPLTQEFQKDGWRMPEHKAVSIRKIDEGEAPADLEDYVHIFTGFRTHSIIWQSFARLPKLRKCRVFAFTEAPPEYGFAGLLRRLKYEWNAIKLHGKLDGVLALGQRGFSYYSRLLRSPRQVHLFAYYDQPLSHFPVFKKREHKKRVELLYVGRFIPLKGLDRMLKALSRTKPCQVDWHLTLLGEGPCKAKLESLAKRLSLTKCISWCAPVSASKVEAFYGRSDYLLQPSRADGWGMTIIEALRFGCEPIASTACGAVDVVEPCFRLSTNQENKWPLVFRRALERGPLSFAKCEANAKRAGAYSAEAGSQKLHDILFSSER